MIRALNVRGGGWKWRGYSLSYIKSTQRRALLRTRARFFLSLFLKSLSPSSFSLSHFRRFERFSFRKTIVTRLEMDGMKKKRERERGKKKSVDFQRRALRRNGDESEDNSRRGFHLPAPEVSGENRKRRREMVVTGPCRLSKGGRHFRVGVCLRGWKGERGANDAAVPLLLFRD